MKIVVTGAAGFIGSHVAEAFTDKNEVVGIDNFADHYSPALKRLNAKQVESAGGQIREADLITNIDIPEGTDVVIHCAAQPGISSDVSFVTYKRNNIQATQNLLTACCKQEHPPFFLHISTSSVYGLEATGREHAEPKPASDYGVTKLTAEQLALSHYRQDKLSAASLRLFSVYVPRERPEKLFTKLIHAGETNQAFPLYKGSREHVRSFTYVGDVVAAIKKVVDNPKKTQGEIINIGTDTTRTTGEAIKAVEQAVGEEIEIDLQPPRDGDQSKTSATIDKARKLLDWEPETTLEKGVKEHVEWFKKHSIADLL